MFHLIFQHVNVEVISRHDPAGKVTPLTLKWPDGRVFEVDRCPFELSSLLNTTAIKVPNISTILRLLRFRSGRFFIMQNKKCLHLQTAGTFAGLNICLCM
jgi:hypothetical protein